MRAPPVSPSLHLCNSMSTNARVRLHCGQRRIWDAWVPAAGTISVPALAPERVTLSASATEVPTRVSRSAVLHDVPGYGSYVAALRQDRGALLFTLSAEQGDSATGLWLTNTTRWALDFKLGVCASPYEMLGYLEPGVSLDDVWAKPLSMDVIAEGLSICLPLVAAAGVWQIESSAEPAGFQVVARDSLNAHRSRA